MKRGYRIYVAGPMPQGEQIRNVRRAIDVAARLADAGLAPFVPHLSYLWELVAPRTHMEWIAFDLPWIDVSDAVVRLSGPSAGADIEEVHANEVGVPVFKGLSDDDLVFACIQHFEIKTVD